MSINSLPIDPEKPDLEIPAFLRPKVVSHTQAVHKLQKVLVVGAGGAGSNYVRHLATKNIKDVDCVIADTDNNHISALSRAGERVRGQSTEERGVEVIRYLLTNNQTSPRWKEFSDLVRQYRVVVINAGLGGYSGSMLAPMIAQVVQKIGALPIVHCSTPFDMEGSGHMKRASSSINELRMLDCYTLKHDNEMIHQYERSTTEDYFELVHDLFDQEIELLASIAKTADSRITVEEVRKSRFLVIE